MKSDKDSEEKKNEEEQNEIKENKIEIIKEESSEEHEIKDEKEDKNEKKDEKIIEKKEVIKIAEKKEIIKEDKNIIIQEKKNEPEINLNDLRLSCPNCDFIPALFFDVKSRNIYEVSSGCENKHLISNMPIKEYCSKCLKEKNKKKNNINDFICLSHNSNYNSFCKTCQKNTCKECSETNHKNHIISQYFELLPSNEELIQLKNSVESEINDTENFLVDTFRKWINEVQKKFNELIEVIKYKNKLYNFVINFYESKEFNYQNIYNIKTILENQLKRNPLTQEIQTLKNIVTRYEGLLKNDKIDKDELKESNDNYLKLKSAQFLKILNVIDLDLNNNYKFEPFDGNDNTLESFLDTKKSAPLPGDYVVVNPYNKAKLSGSIVNNINNSDSEINEKMRKSLTLAEKMQFANEVKVSKKKLQQNMEQESIVHSLCVLKDYKGNNINKFAAGLDNGTIKVYYVDPKTSNIYLDFEIKEHSSAVTYMTWLHDGRIITCSQDQTMKLIEETISYSYLLSFWRRYYLLQTLVKPNTDKYNPFQPVSVIEINNNTLVSGDWKTIIIWKLIQKKEKKHKNKAKINFSFDINDYNKNKYKYYYEVYKEIPINTSVTSLINIDGKNFISSHYGPGIITFYNIYDSISKSLKDIKCVDSANQCMTLIEVAKPECNWDKEKILVVGGYKCIYLVSIKGQNLIDKISLPGNDYVKCLINTGISELSNGFILAGFFGHCSYDVAHFNAKSQLGFSELLVNEIARIKEASKASIKSLILVKKNIYDNTNNQKNIVLITSGTERSIRTFIDPENDEDDDD